MQIGSNISAATLQLFGIDSPKPSVATHGAPEITPSSAATYFVSGVSEDVGGMSGFYSDPREFNSSAYQKASLAEKTVSAVKNVMANELREAKLDARKMVEDELGRTLAEGETFMSLSSYEHAELSHETYKANNEARLAEAFLSLASAKPDHFNLRNLAEQPGEKLNIKTEEGREAAVERALNAIVNLQMGGIVGAISNGDLSGELVTSALSESGAENSEDLRSSYYQLQKLRFENGELSLSYDGEGIE